MLTRNLETLLPGLLPASLKVLEADHTSERSRCRQTPSKPAVKPGHVAFCCLLHDSTRLCQSAQSSQPWLRRSQLDAIAATCSLKTRAHVQRPHPEARTQGGEANKHVGLVCSVPFSFIPGPDDGQNSGEDLAFLRKTVLNAVLPKDPSSKVGTQAPLPLPRFLSQEVKRAEIECLDPEIIGCHKQIHRLNGLQKSAFRVGTVLLSRTEAGHGVKIRTQGVSKLSCGKYVTFWGKSEVLIS